MPHGGLAVDVALHGVVGGLGVAAKGELAEHGRGQDRRGAGEQSPPRKFSHA
jgi:hypothetical protein